MFIESELQTVGAATAKARETNWSVVAEEAGLHQVNGGMLTDWLLCTV